MIIIQRREPGDTGIMEGKQFQFEVYEVNEKGGVAEPVDNRPVFSDFCQILISQFPDNVLATGAAVY